MNTDLITDETVELSNGSRMKMQPTRTPEGWEYVEKLHGSHDKEWFLWFHQNKNRVVWAEETEGRETNLVLAADIGMLWYDEKGEIIPQSEYWASQIFVLIRKKI